MALKDLVASKSSLSEDVIEEIVTEYVRFDPDHKAIVFTPEAYRLSNRAKVLVYLVALQGWSFVLDDAVPIDAKPSDLELNLGIIGGSLRPILKELKDRNIVIERGGRYSVRATALQTIKSELKDASSSSPASPAKKTKSKPRRNSKDYGLENTPKAEAKADKRTRRSSSSNNLSERFSAWIEDGFFDTPRSLADVQHRFHKAAVIVPQTSIPPYLLKATRSGLLERNKEEKNGRRVWVYQRKRK